MRQMADTDLFINITNDAWFGDTQAPHQHAMLSTVQAIQYGSVAAKNSLHWGVFPG